MNRLSDNIEDHILLVTGGTSGVGKATAMGLAGKGAKVVIISRSVERSQNVLQEIAKKTGNDRCEFLIGDLSLQSNIRDLADQFKRKYDRLDVLADCAGAILSNKAYTSEGIERSFAINYLSHFGLTTGLLDILKASESSRVITIAGSPGFIKKAHLDFENIQLLQNYSVIRATINALYARLIFTAELARRLSGTKVTANAFHPGLVKSSLAVNAPWYIKFVDILSKPFQHSTCDITTYLSLSDEVKDVSGKLFNPDGKMHSLDIAGSEAAGRKLWEVSEQLVQETRLF